MIIDLDDLKNQLIHIQVGTELERKFIENLLDQAYHLGSREVLRELQLQNKINQQKSDSVKVASK